MAKITLQEWMQMLNDPSKTDDEIMEYSKVVQGPTAFAIYVMPDPEKVDFPDDPETQENAMALGNGLARARREARFNFRRIMGDKAPVLVSEMDSWGQFPFLIREVVDHLNDHFNVFSVGAAGDTAENMVFGPKGFGGQEYMIALDQQAKHARAFVFSAAGNDIIGEDPETTKPVLTALLKPFNGDITDVAGHIDHAKLQEKLDFLEHAYSTVIKTIRTDNRFRKLPIIIHGYDYPFPGPWGAGDPRDPVYAAKDRWLGKPLADRKIPLDPLGRNVIAFMLDRLYEMMTGLAGDSSQSQVWVVDCRNILTKVSDWNDEIHGTSAGFKKITRKFRETLAAAGVEP